jgi:hypothetical protein
LRVLDNAPVGKYMYYSDLHLHTFYVKWNFRDPYSSPEWVLNSPV